eukprot:9100484-Prorocentrum_lima.AAC.1
MTSSLVGSEMCIRDSHRWYQACPLVSTAKCGCPATSLGIPSSWGRWDAVSYTHLTLPTICSV